MCLLALLVLFLTAYLFSLRSSIGEIASELNEKLGTDTNTLISISSADKSVRKLASQINVELRSLRNEKLKLQNGNIELRSAVTNVSHDLRTPLTAICGYLDLLDKEEHSENSGRYLAIIRERTESMKSITEDLFRYSVIMGKADNLSLYPVNINDILEQSIVGFYSTLSARGIEPDIHIPSKKVVRKLDKSALQRIFENILNNAAKYSDGDLSITLTESGTISFANSASSLDHVSANLLFERFFTVESASGSAGLGLSIAKVLTEKMCGTITAEYSRGKLIIQIDFPKNNC